MAIAVFAGFVILCTIIGAVISNSPSALAERARRAEQARIEAEKSAKLELVDIENAIKNHKVRVGMTAEQCRRSWGKPQSINRTHSTNGTHEQWVYGSKSYLYMEDGILTTIQN